MLESVNLKLFMQTTSKWNKKVSNSYRYYHETTLRCYTFINDDVGLLEVTLPPKAHIGSNQKG